jgi:hypothetical protein
MKALKIIGIILGVLVLSGGVAWAALLRAPSEAELCGHLEQLMDKQLPGFSASPAAAEFKAECPKKVQKGDLEGALPYAKKAKCIMAADSMDAVQACSKK